MLCSKGKPQQTYYLGRYDNASLAAFERGRTMKSVAHLLAVMAYLVAPVTAHAQKAEMPAPTAFNVGDTWEWRQVDNRTKLEERKLTRTVVKVDGILQFSDGTTNSQISAAFIDGGYNHSQKPWRVWPLEVGKKWVFDADWVRGDGVTGNTKQDVEVVAYEEVAVPAGKFMAFKIEHRGWYRNSRGGRAEMGGSGQQNDTFWYAPDVNAHVKHIRDDGYNMYTRELITYKRGAS